MNKIINQCIHWKDATKFIPPIYSGYVIKVYDGDTITIASRLPYEHSLLYRFPIRLKGIDCPEINSKKEEDKLIANIAKELLINIY